mmetsp:Transcript_12781/g.36085  ORF Transcript_12781/g.36085 Transcript_12781/m.36085 type:complete len:334 (+) Transcript_12781:177-1178(+)
MATTRAHVPRTYVLFCCILIWSYYQLHVSHTTLIDIHNKFQSLGSLRSIKVDTPVKDSVDGRKGKCLGLDPKEEIDTLLSQYEQVFVTMPAKAAGTSMKIFMKHCMPEDVRNFKNVIVNKYARTELLTASFHPPALIASHAGNKMTLQQLFKHATKQSLVIYLHREETSRLLSAIRHVLAKRVCPRGNDEVNNPIDCTLTETELLTVIQKKEDEIQMGGPSLLACDSYDVIDTYAPNLVFIHYKQATRLQKLLAKRFCPQTSGVRTRNSGDKKIDVLLDSDSKTIVSLDAWLEAKRNILEFALGLRTNNEWCQAKTRVMEDDLLGCPDEALLF